jgi:hypothetical protein
MRLSMSKEDFIKNLVKAAQLDEWSENEIFYLEMSKKT